MADLMFYEFEAYKKIAANKTSPTQTTFSPAVTAIITGRFPIYT